MDNSVILGGAPRVPRRAHRPKPGEPRAAERSFARDLPADRRKLSGDRRAARLAQPVAADPDAAVAGVGPQRHGGPRAARPDLRATHVGRTIADRARPALLRRRAEADTRTPRERT